MLCLTACEDLDATKMTVVKDRQGYRCEACPEGMEGDGTTCHGEYTKEAWHAGDLYYKYVIF